MDGLLRDKTRKPGKPPHTGGDGGARGGAHLRRAAGQGDPLDRPDDGRGRAGCPCGPCSGSGRPTSCSRTGCAPSSAARDPEFVAKLEDIVGLYLAPPRHAVVLSVDEKSQIQAIDRDPARPAAQARQGRDDDRRHVRHGTTALVRRAQRPRRHRARPLHGPPPPPGVIRCLNAIEAPVPAGKLVHVILDNYAHPQAPKVHGLARPAPALDLPLHSDLRLPRRPPAWVPAATHRSRCELHSTPTRAFFSAITAAGCAAACSVRWSTSRPRSTATSPSTMPIPKPFVWTATPGRHHDQTEPNECVRALDCPARQRSFSHQKAALQPRLRQLGAR